MTIPKFVTYPELPAYGVPKFSRKHMLDLQKQGKFPKARQLTSQRIAWVEDEILDWIASRPVAIAVRDAEPRSARLVRRARTEAVERVKGSGRRDE
jgi:Prophage CP4-57 regulatory protein (AlpA)